MADSDELCVLCGIRPVCSPLYVMDDDGSPSRASVNKTADGEFLINLIAQEIFESRQTLTSLEDVQSILRTAFLIFRETRFALRKTRRKIGYHLPAQSMDLGYDHDSLAIGHFYASGEYIPVVGADGLSLRHPAGDGVEVRRVRHGHGGIFDARVLEDECGGRVLDWSEKTFCQTAWRDGGRFNLFVHIPCFHYLQAWLISDMPPRASPRGEPLTLAGELYEVVNSRESPRVSGMSTLECIDYGSVIRCYDGKTQIYMEGGRKNSQNTERALQEGKTGEELLPAIMKDYQCWAFMRPDDWPRRTAISLYDYPTNHLVVGRARDRISTLPLELYPELLLHMSMRSILALATTAKHTRAVLMHPCVLGHVLRCALTRPDGLLHWILPVESLPEEHRAKESLCTWFHSEPNSAFRDYDFGDDSDDDTYRFEEGEDTTSDISSDEENEASSDDELDTSDLDVPIPDADARPMSPSLSSSELMFHPAFPLYAFVRACHLSDSMRARQRRWRIIKQFDGLWDAYRRHGWERDEFIPA